MDWESQKGHWHFLLDGSINLKKCNVIKERKLQGEESLADLNAITDC